MVNIKGRPRERGNNAGAGKGGRRAKNMNIVWRGNKKSSFPTFAYMQHMYLQRLPERRGGGKLPNIEFLPGGRRQRGTAARPLRAYWPAAAADKSHLQCCTEKAPPRNWRPSQEDPVRKGATGAGTHLDGGTTGEWPSQGCVGQFSSLSVSFGRIKLGDLFASRRKRESRKTNIARTLLCFPGSKTTAIKSKCWTIRLSHAYAPPPAPVASAHGTLTYDESCIKKDTRRVNQ